MNKIALAAILGVIVFTIAFGLVGYRLTQIRERLVYPYLAKKTISEPSTKTLIKNSDGTDGIIFEYNNADATEKSAAIFFPNELLDLSLQETKIKELKQKYSYLVVPYYRGVLSNNTTWPREVLVYKDAHSVIEYIKSKQILVSYIGGDRLGSAVASYLASKYPVEKLELINPWISTGEVFGKAPLLYLLQFFGWDDFDTLKTLSTTLAKNVFIQVDKESMSIAERLQKVLPSTARAELMK